MSRNKKIGVLLISDFGDKGGASLQLLDLIDELVKKEVSITVLVKNKNRTYDALKNKGVKVIVGFFSPFYLSTDTGMIRFILKVIPRYLQYLYTKYISICEILKHNDLSNIDIVHSFNNRTDIGALIASKIGAKHIWHIHEFGELDYGCVSMKYNYIGYINKHSDAVLCVSKIVRNHWISKGIQENKCFYLYNGVKGGCRSRIYTKFSGVLKCCLVGTLCETKGQDFVIEAISLLPKSYRDKIKMSFIGPGKNEYISYLKEKIKRLNLDDIIDIQGFTTKVNDELLKYDVGITCSKNEAFGRVTIEYMLAGLLTLACDTGANSELVDNEVNGLLFRRTNPQFLCNTLCNVIDNFDLYIPVANNGYLYAIQSYSTKSYAESTYHFYKSLQEGVIDGYK